MDTRDPNHENCSLDRRVLMMIFRREYSVGLLMVSSIPDVAL